MIYKISYTATGQLDIQNILEIGDYHHNDIAIMVDTIQIICSINYAYENKTVFNNDCHLVWM